MGGKVSAVGPEGPCPFLARPARGLYLSAGARQRGSRSISRPYARRRILDQRSPKCECGAAPTLWPGPGRGRSALRSIAGPVAASILIAALWASVEARQADETARPALPILVTQIPASALRSPGYARESPRPNATPARSSPGRSSPLPSGSRIVLYAERGGKPGIVDLTPGFDAAARPDLSFDGQRILFIGRRRPGEGTGIWEMRLDGSEARLVLRTPQDCTRAIYLSTVFTLNAETPEPLIAFSTVRASAGQSRDDTEDLYTCRMDGSRVRRITFNPYGSRDPLLLSDGRLVHESARSGGGSSLLTVNVDGTDLFAFAGLEDAVLRRRMPCETSDGQVVYVESEAGSDALGGGALVSVTRTHSIGTRRVVASDTDGSFLSPSPLPGGRLLVSYRPRSSATYAVALLDPSRGGPPTVLFDDPGRHELDAIVVQPRPRPAGRSSVVNETVDYGFLYCLDAAETMGVRLDRARITGVRVLAAEPPQADPRAGAPVREKLLGEVPIEADGSFSLQVPAATALRLEALDRQGGVLAAMQSWIWVMPMERRGCIGCHEDRNLTPPNRFALALRATPRPVGLAAHSPAGPGTHGPVVGDYP